MNKILNNQLKTLAVFYFLIEVAINYSLYKQLSFNSNIYTVGSLELWAKIVIGFGAALLLIQAISFIGDKVKDREIVSFLAICIFTIPLSFFAQARIIDAVIVSADKDTINNSVLLVATKSTLVPYYNYSMATYPHNGVGNGEFWKIVYPLRFRKNAVSGPYFRHEKHFFDIASYCTSHSEDVLNVDRSIDKVFFSFNVIRDQSVINESEYKSLIKTFYSCLYNDESYKNMHIKGIEHSDIASSQFDRYLKKRREYEDYITKAEKYEDTASIKKIKREWRKQMNKEFGFKTKISPDLGYYEFVENSDVKRAFHNREGKDALWPYGQEWEDHVNKTIMDSLPDKLILGYTNQDGSIVKVGREETAVDGREAYKSIIMPIIGLGLSALFLVFNLISTITFIIVRKSKTIAVIFFISATSWAVFWPNYHFMESTDSGNDLISISSLIKIVYYHEKNIGKIYDINPFALVPYLQDMSTGISDDGVNKS